METTIKEGETSTVQIEGASCFYVLTVDTGDGLGSAIFGNSREERVGLKTALRECRAGGRRVALLRAST